MKQFNYSLSTNTIWFNNDNGTVEAETEEQAEILAKAKINKAVNAINEAIKGIDELSVNLNDLEVTEIKKN